MNHEHEPVLATNVVKPTAQLATWIMKLWLSGNCPQTIIPYTSGLFNLMLEVLNSQCLAYLLYFCFYFNWYMF